MKEAPPPEFQLGVLFVHGIGTQRPTETLVRWGDALIDVLSRTTVGRATVTVEDAGPGNESGTAGSEMIVRISCDGREERWLMAEGWWADCFPAPSYGELVSWSLRAVPWFVAMHFAGRYWQFDKMPWNRQKITAVLGVLVQLPIALLLAPAFIVLMGFVLLLGLIPVSQLQSLSLTMQSMLTGSVGDSLAFVESPVRAALVRTRILERFTLLRQRSEHAVIVAHSQGAAAALDALGGFEPRSGYQTDDTVKEPNDARPVVDALVTFGAGTNQIASLRALSAGLPKSERNPAWFALGSLAVFVVVSAYLYAQSKPLDFALALTGWVAGIGALALVGWLLVTSIDRLIGIWPAIKARRDSFIVWTLTACVVIWIAATQFLTDRSSVPFNAVNFLMLSLMGVLGSIAMLLSKEMRASVTTVTRPKTVARWVDVFASADPVPNGPTRTTDDHNTESTLVWNRGSIFSDHTTYWENLDGFVLRVARICAETAGSTWTQILPPSSKALDRRAAWRVPFLAWAARLHLLLWLGVFYFAWTQYGVLVPMPFEAPVWMPRLASSVAQFIVLVLSVGLLAWLAAALLRWPWRLWVSQEQRSVLARTLPVGWPWIPVLAMGMVLSGIAMGLDGLAHREASMIGRELLRSTGRLDQFLSGLGDVPVITLGLGGVLTLIARVLWQLPRSDT